ncbi:MAG: hypothetical protein R3E89_10205 [Thiolinea sp.]
MQKWVCLMGVMLIMLTTTVVSGEESVNSENTILFRFAEKEITVVLVDNSDTQSGGAVAIESGI